VEEQEQKRTRQDALQTANKLPRHKNICYSVHDVTSGKDVVMEVYLVGFEGNESVKDQN